VNNKLIALLAGVVAAALAVAGCGSGGDEVTASSLTKAEFIKKADAACKKSEDQIQADFAAYAKKHKDITKPTEADYAELIDVVLVPNVEQEVEDIRSLGAPSGDEDQVEAMLDALDEGIERAEDEPKVLISNSTKIFGKASKLAEDYGLKICGTR
jgi:hypothetical protein